MPFIERMTKVCHAAIKAKGGYLQGFLPGLKKSKNVPIEGLEKSKI